MSEILVVGAGPSGLTLAAELYRHGVDCRLVEAAQETHGESRATDIQSRTLEALDLMGVLPDFMAEGVPRNLFALFNDGKLIFEVDLGDADTEHGVMLGIAQDQSERLLAAHLERLGGQVERGVKLVDFAQDPEGVTVQLQHGGDGRMETQRFAWVIGCDGAHSAVRKQLGLAFRGNTYEGGFFLTDVHFAPGIETNTVRGYVSDDGAVLVLPIPGEGVVRITGEYWEDEPPTPAALQEILEKRIQHELPEVRGLGWNAVFRVHSRLVDRYRVGRVFLAGDAAHIHSPVGGHGMNTSMQDAFNLAWKLAWVAKGWSPQGLLDSYEAERRPIARMLLWETDFNTRAMMVRSTHLRKALGLLMGASVMGIPPLRREMIARTLELHVAYKPNPWLGEHHSSVLQAEVIRSAQTEAPCVTEHVQFTMGPSPGHRVPDIPIAALGRRLYTWLARPGVSLLLFDGRDATLEGDHNLVGIATEILERWPGRVQIAVLTPRNTWKDTPLAAAPVPVWYDPEMTAHHRFGAAAECLYLLRPDGYVGYRSQPADREKLLDYLGTIWPD